MKTATRNILAIVGVLLVAGIVSVVEIDFSRLIPPKTTGPCFNSDYWDARYEKSQKAKLQPTIKGIDVSHHNGNIKWDVLAEKDHIRFDGRTHRCR